MADKINAKRIPKITRAYVAKSDEREAMASAVGIKIINVKAADVVNENIAAPVWTLRAGELLAVFGLEAFGRTRQEIAAAVAWVQGQGADVYEIASDAVAGKGVAMLNQALSRIHGKDRIKSGAAAKEMQRASVAKRTAARMSEDEAREHWMNPRLTSKQAIAKMTGWAHSSAYKVFGKRQRTPGRPIKKGEGRVYFIRSNGKGPVKIGYATNVPDRLKALQTSHHGRLVIVGLMAGTQQDERALHAQFKEYRKGGEWFDCKGELKAYIEALPKWTGKI